MNMSHLSENSSPMQTGVVPTKYWHALENGKVQCDLCPRACHMAEGQRGLCFVRANQGGTVVLTTWGRSSGFCVDPIEKKPLNHFLPGSSVLSFGTAGCNLSCKFCQNWDMSKSREMDILASRAEPELIAARAVELGCQSVAFTYNDPVIFHEYALDTAAACHERGIKTVAVTAGYISPEPRVEFFAGMDAANVDLKSFSDDFYFKLTGAHLQPVLDTLEYIHKETNTWLEITTLLIPGKNDSDEELSAMVDWLLSHVGDQVPLHFSAFHPSWKMLDVPSTPLSTLVRARQLALNKGLKYVYTGNLHDPEGQSTWCPSCKQLVIGRDGYDLTDWSLDAQGACSKCGTKVAGVFESSPGHWGSRRLRVAM